jgi:hypothetical protein
MFTMVGSAGAATFSDVTGTSAESAAIYKLNGLGIIDGYQDGTFGPEKNITRAEFAKIACVTAGLKSVASGMGATASPFSDVATDHWANGWINVAAAQGFVKGDPAGTFRPEDQITQAEAVTVLLRLLGYNDNLAGEWPSDYIAKAANLGVLDDVTFVSNQAATRGVVAILTSAILDENVVEYKASDNIFENKLDKNNDPYTLLFDKFDDADKVEDAFVYSVDVANDEFTLKYYAYDETDDDWSMVATGKTVTLTDDVVISGGKSALDAQMRYVDFIKNDDGDATYVEIKNYGVIKTSKIETKELKTDGGNINNGATLAQKIQDEDTDIEYDFAPDVIWRPESTGFGPTLQKTAAINDAADYYEFTLNGDGDVAGVNVSTMPAPGIVDFVNTDRETISFKTNPVECLTALGTNYTTKAANLSDKTYFVNKNGMPGKLSDIQEGDVVWILNGQDNYKEAGYNGVDYYIVAVSRAAMSVTGTLESVEDRDDGYLKKVTVDGKTYNVVSSMNYDAGRADLQLANVAGFTSGVRVVPFLSTDGGDEFEYLPGATTATALGGFRIYQRRIL